MLNYSYFLKFKGANMGENTQIVLQEKKDYQLVDILKFVFCLLIIGIHTGVTPDFAYGMALFRLGVPFFFVTSGFFLGKKVLTVNEKDTFKTIKRYCLRLLKPFIVFTIIDFLFYFIINIPKGKTFFECLTYKSLRLFVYPGGALWYVAACMVGALLLIPFLRHKKINLAIIIGIALYGFSLLCNNYYFLATNTRVEIWISFYLKYFVSARNGVFCGFVFLSIGVKCAQIFYVKQIKLSRKLIYLLLAASFVVYAVEVQIIARLTEGLFREDGGYYVTQLFLVPILLLSALLTPIKIPTKISRLFRDLSVGLYFLHSPLINLVSFFGISNNIAYYFTVLSIGLAICLLTYKIKKEPFYSLLR